MFYRPAADFVPSLRNDLRLREISCLSDVHNHVKLSSLSSRKCIYFTGLMLEAQCAGLDRLKENLSTDPLTQPGFVGSVSPTTAHKVSESNVCN